MCQVNMAVCMFNQCKQLNHSVLGAFPGIFPATSINLLLVAVNLTEVMISHAITPLA